MPQLIWTPAALLDIQRLYQFLAVKDRQAAQKTVASIRSSINILAHHPQAGRPIEDMEIEFREWPNNFGNSGYIIALYHFDGSTAVLLAVRYQSEAGY